MKAGIIFIIVAVAVVFGLSVLTDNRIAAGAGAAILLGAIIYGYLRNKGASAETTRRAEAGAHDLREEIAEDEERRGPVDL